MVVNGYGNRFFCSFLANDVFVEMGFDFFGLEKFHLIGNWLFLDDVYAEANAFIADVGVRSGDEFFYDVFGPSAKGTAGHFGGVVFLVIGCYQGMLAFNSGFRASAAAFN